MVSGAIQISGKEIPECPFGLDCYPSCFWWENGKCAFPQKADKRNPGRKKIKQKLEAIGIYNIGNKKNQKLLNYIGNSLLTATSCALLWFFGCIWVEGSHYIQEPNTIILTMETLIIVACLGLALHNIARLIGKKSG
jgi:hypothetical protein